MDFIAGSIVGLIVGWNLLPQPAWVKRLYDAAYRRVQAWAAGITTDDGEEV